MPYNPNGLCQESHIMRGSEFAELKAFVAVVERQSFARAAEHLGVSPSALSQTIRQLEGRLGTRLLNRTTRSVAPSASGGRLYARIAPLFQELAVAVAETSEASGRINGTLRINTLGIAARTLIAPRLARFHQAYPDVVVDIVVDDALSDIVSGRFDAGIRVVVSSEGHGGHPPHPGPEHGGRGVTGLPGTPRNTANSGGTAGSRLHQLAAAERWRGSTDGSSRSEVATSRSPWTVLSSPITLTSGLRRPWPALESPITSNRMVWANCWHRDCWCGYWRIGRSRGPGFSLLPEQAASPRPAGCVH